MWLYHFVMGVLRIYYFFAFKTTVIGKENIPKEGSAVLCSNHISNYDPITMAVFINRLPRYIAKKELFQNPILGRFLTALEAFPVDRQATMDMKSFKTAINILKSGEMLGIFAEGTRVKEGDAKAAKAGVALFALKGNAPIIPVAISGKYKFRGHVTIQYGEPISLEEYKGQKVSTELLEQITDKIMSQIKEMKEANG